MYWIGLKTIVYRLAVSSMSDSESPPEGSAGLDLVFSVLRKHEESLDRVARRLGDIADALSMVKEPSARPKVEVKTLAVENIADWKEFKDRSSAAVKVLYEIGISFSVRAIMPNGRILKYSEALLKSEVSFYTISEAGGDKSGGAQQKQVLKLECGLEYALRRTESILPEGEYTQGILVSLDLNKVRDWLADQIGVEASKISSGRVVI